jgi:hypothetical protein
VVRIRYTELQSGLHVDARTQGGDTVVYLLPGLTPAERRVALTRVRSFSRLGHGPRLSLTSLAVAVGVDRIRTTISNGAAAVRSHPILLLPSALVMSGTAFALVWLAAVTFHLHAGYGNASAGAMPITRVGISSVATSSRHSATVNPWTDWRWQREGSRASQAQQRRASLRAEMRRGKVPRNDWPPRPMPGVSPSAPVPVSNGCVVYGVFGVCDNS